MLYNQYELQQKPLKLNILNYKTEHQPFAVLFLDWFAFNCKVLVFLIFCPPPAYCMTCGIRYDFNPTFHGGLLKYATPPRSVSCWHLVDAEGNNKDKQSEHTIWQDTINVNAWGFGDFADLYSVCCIWYPLHLAIDIQQGECLDLSGQCSTLKQTLFFWVCILILKFRQGFEKSHKHTTMAHECLYSLGCGIMLREKKNIKLWFYRGSSIV